MIKLLKRIFASNPQATMISVDCLHNRHKLCPECHCYCHSKPTVLKAMHDAVLSTSEPAYDFEHSMWNNVRRAA